MRSVVYKLVSTIQAELSFNLYWCKYFDWLHMNQMSMISEVDECLEHECENGSCVDGLAQYTCTCWDGFNGEFCEISKKHLTRHCHFLPPRSINGTLTVIRNVSRSWCIIIPDIDECAGVQCVYGSCEDGINEYTCDCDDGYTGVNCETGKYRHWYWWYMVKLRHVRLLRF